MVSNDPGGTGSRGCDVNLPDRLPVPDRGPCRSGRLGAWRHRASSFCRAASTRDSSREPTRSITPLRSGSVTNAVFVLMSASPSAASQSTSRSTLRRPSADLPQAAGAAGFAVVCRRVATAQRESLCPPVDAAGGHAVVRGRHAVYRRDSLGVAQREVAARPAPNLASTAGAPHARRGAGPRGLADGSR